MAESAESTLSGWNPAQQRWTEEHAQPDLDDDAGDQATGKPGEQRGGDGRDGDDRELRDVAQGHVSRPA